jgi:Swiss Army Knife RNA repair-like protein
MKPLLFVDVDGVLNVLRAGIPKGFRTHVCNGYTITYDPANAERLARLAEHFDLVWGTTWEEGANEWIAPLFGLARLPVCELPILRDSTQRSDPSWKLRDILAYAGDRPFVWLDDMIYADASHRLRDRKHWALARVDPQKGLTEELTRGLIELAPGLATEDAHGE